MSSRRALLIAGGVDLSLEQPRYFYDLAAFYRVLICQYGYPKDDVRVHWAYGTGKDLDGDGQQEILSPATHLLVDESLDWLSQLGAGDQLLIIVSNHGTPDGFCLWGPGNLVTPAQLQTSLSRTEARKILIFGQCHSGIFSALSLSHLVVCGSCGPNERSYARPNPTSGFPVYDEFLYQLLGAFSGKYPDGLPLPQAVLPPPNISIREAFEFARTHDVYSGFRTQSHETPFLADPANLASSTTL